MPQNQLSVQVPVTSPRRAARPVSATPLHQLLGLHQRLTAELASVRAAQPLDLGRINRLSADIAATARAVATLQGAVRPVPAITPEPA